LVALSFILEVVSSYKVTEKNYIFLNNFLFQSLSENTSGEKFVFQEEGRNFQEMYAALTDHVNILPSLFIHLLNYGMTLI
jgi:hypothetical protein